MCYLGNLLWHWRINKKQLRLAGVKPGGGNVVESRLEWDLPCCYDSVTTFDPKIILCKVLYPSWNTYTLGLLPISIFKIMFLFWGRGPMSHSIILLRSLRMVVPVCQMSKVNVQAFQIMEDLEDTLGRKMGGNGNAQKGARSNGCCFFQGRKRLWSLDFWTWEYHDILEIFGKWYSPESQYVSRYSKKAFKGVTYVCLFLRPIIFGLHAC